MIASSTASLLVLAALSAQVGGVHGEGPREPRRAVFCENLGQWPEPVLARARFGRATAWLTDEGVRLDLRGAERGARLFLSVEDASPAAARGMGRCVEHRSFLAAETRVAAARTFDSFRLESVRPGIDLVWRADGGVLAYDLHLAPGASLAELTLRVDGADSLTLADDGALHVRTALGILRQTPPVTFAVAADGARREVRSAFRQIDERRFGFVVEADGSEPLVIDPGLEWATFLGAGGEDRGYAIGLDDLGRVIVAGETAAVDFPAAPGAYQLDPQGLTDAYVTCLRADGSAYEWSTYLGGSDTDLVRDLWIDANREIVLAGETRSTDFPTTAGAYDGVHSGFVDAFVARLNRDGTELVSATFVGGAGTDTVSALDVGPSGDVFVCGSTNNGTFPTTTGAFQTTFFGGPFFGPDGYCFRLSEDHSQLEWSTLLGRGEVDVCFDVVVTPNDTPVLGGLTGSMNFPTTAGTLSSVLSGQTEGFLCELSANGASLVWSTLLGGSDRDGVRALALDAAGRVLCGGETTSTDFPGTAASPIQSANGGLQDAFVAAVSANGTQLDWATYLGDEETERLTTLALDAQGNPVVAGGTDSRFFPTTPWALDPFFNGPFVPNTLGGDGWLARVRADGQELSYSTFLGGSADEEILALAIDEANDCHLTGRTFSFQFPSTPGVVDPLFDFSGSDDGFVCQLDFARYPFTYGTAKITSQGSEPYIYFSGLPSVSGPDFDLSLDGAVPNNGRGVLMMGEAPAAAPFFGGTRWVSFPVRRIPITSFGFFGDTSVEIPMAPWMAGRTFFFQFWFEDPGDLFGVGLSEGCEISFVP